VFRLLQITFAFNRSTYKALTTLFHYFFVTFPRYFTRKTWIKCRWLNFILPSWLRNQLSEINDTLFQMVALSLYLPGNLHFPKSISRTFSKSCHGPEK